MSDSHADVIVWGDDLKAGRLPTISPISGQSTDIRRTLRFRTAPGWTWALVLGGVLIGVGWIPGILVMLAASKRAVGPVSLTLAEKRSITIKQLITWGFFFATILALGLTFTLAPNPNAPTGLAFGVVLVTLFAWIVCLFAVIPRIRPQAVVREVAPGRITVELKRVHPRFADAVQQMYRAPVDPSPFEDRSSR